MEKLDPTLVEKVNAEYTSQVRTGSLWRMAFRRLIRQRSSQIGMFLLGSLFIIVEDVMMRAPPCIHLLGCPESEPQHIMGTDSQARDFYSRIIYGSRISLFIGISTIGSAILIGTFLGAVAGFSGGWWNFVIMRVV